MINIRDIDEIIGINHMKIGIYICDHQGNEIIRNIDRQFVAASLIKLFILLAVDESQFNREIEIGEKEKVEGGVLDKLKGHLTFNIENLAMFMIAYSDNTATNILIDVLGMDKINFVIKEYGFLDTKLNRKMLDLKAKDKGLENYTSPKDVYRVLKVLYGVPKFKTMLESQGVNNKISLYLSENEDVKFIHKTGELKNVEHDVGRLIYKDRFIDVIVLLEELQNNDIGIKIHNKIGELLIRELKEQNN